MKNFLRKIFNWNKLISEEQWYNAITIRGEILFKDEDGSSYKKYLRDKKINELGI